MVQRILVIEDEDALLDFYTLLLEREGYEVYASKEFFEDVQEVERLAPSLIILDIMRGHQNQGLRLLDQLQAHPPTQTIPVIIATAALQEIQESEASLRQKSVPVIYKPFQVEELLATIKEKLSSP